MVQAEVSLHIRKGPVYKEDSGKTSCDETIMRRGCLDKFKKFEGEGEENLRRWQLEERC
jgi:hypothetical protein